MYTVMCIEHYRERDIMYTVMCIEHYRERERRKGKVYQKEHKCIYNKYTCNTQLESITSSAYLQQPTAILQQCSPKYFR